MSAALKPASLVRGCLARVALMAVFWLAFAAPAYAADPRICYADPAAIPRDKDGSIKRSAAVRREFVRLHPCPSGGTPSGACPGWYVDHVIPLACGGCDSVSNMQWLPSAAWRDKTRWERSVYCGGQR
jgi:hypothetical protein